MNNLSIEEKFELAQALFKRENLGEDASEKFRKEYPGADESTIHTLAFHLYIDGHEALLNMLCELELFLRHDLNYSLNGRIFDVIYHLYNYRLLTNIIPETAKDVIDEIDDLKELILEEPQDVGGILRSLNKMKEMMEGNADIPDEL